ncbi:hypothetical protein CEXT_773641 [Caerostris extrusa]|uniref:Uncharacterized protein n=1 Tax=Caerostris extrusa TaxID=172846 RepID=A0AAV4MZC2_CAEEX|nr:hypothetical protein CEXT_773641 [Caerostris extrusa]
MHPQISTNIECDTIVRRRFTVGIVQVLEGHSADIENKVLDVPPPCRSSPPGKWNCPPLRARVKPLQGWEVLGQDLELPPRNGLGADASARFLQRKLRF